MSVAGRQAAQSSRSASMRPAGIAPAASSVHAPRRAAACWRAALHGPAPAVAPSSLRARSTPVSRAQPADAAAAVAAAAPAAAATPLPALPPLDASYEAAAAFAPYANWLLPGRLLLGRYPHVEPSRCASHEQGDRQVEEIMEAGPRTFVGLQAELPPQGQMRIGGVGGFLPYKAAAELVAASLTPPPPMEVVNGLRNPTLDKFLPQRKRAAGQDVQDYYAREVVSFVHCPIEDLGVPTMQQLTEIVSDLRRRLERGESIYLHCWGGRGRAGTVGAALLVDAYGLSADEALERVQRAFDTRHDSERRSPETEQQAQLVRDYAAAARA